jgi:hypothetical protein
MNQKTLVLVKHEYQHHAGAQIHTKRHRDEREKSKGKLIFVHATNKYGGFDIWLHELLNSTLSGRFKLPRKCPPPPGTHVDPPLGLDQAWSTSYVVRANSAKFGLHAGSMTSNTQNEGLISTRTIVPEYLSTQHVQ